MKKKTPKKIADISVPAIEYSKTKQPPQEAISSSDFPFLSAPDLPRLMRALRRARGFSLYFVRCNAPQMRHELANWIKQNLAKPVFDIDLRNSQMADPIFAITAAAEDSPEQAVLFVVGLEHWLSELNPERRQQTLQALNWRRNELARINRPLVFWVPEFTIPLLAEGAPDFWDWHSGFYEFAIPQQEKSRMFVQEGVQDSSITSLSEDKKNERILLFKQLLDEYSGPSELERRKSAEIRYQLGQLYASLGHYDKAMEALQGALKIQQNQKNKKGIAACFNEIGRICLARADYDMALKYLKESLQISREIGNRAGEGRTLNNIGQIYKARGDYDTALRYLEESLKIQREIGDRAGEGATLNNISQIYDARGDYDTALRYLEESLKIRREIGDRAGMIPTLHNLAGIFVEKGRIEEAVKAYGEALQLAVQIQSPRDIYNECTSLGALLCQLGAKEHGLPLLKQAVDIGRAMGAPDVGEVEELLRRYQ